MQISSPEFGKNISPEGKSDLVTLGLYQLVGGVIGVQLIIWLTFTAPVITFHSVSVKLFMLLFYAYSIFCGILCMKYNPTALRYSLINQSLQVIGFVGLGYTFKYIAGIYVSIGLDLTESIKLVFSAGLSKFHMYKEPWRTEIDFNLIALSIIYLTERLRKKIKADIRKVAEINQP